MKTKFYLCFILLTSFITGWTLAQDTLQAGDSLHVKISEMVDGSTLIIPQGTYYAQYGGLTVLDKSIRIIGEEGEEKPVVYLRKFDLEGTAGIYLEGIEFSCMVWDTVNNKEDSVVYTDSYLINLTSTLTTCPGIKVKNCVIRDVDRALIRGDRAAYSVDSILFEDCIVYNHKGGGNYGLFRLKNQLTFNSLILKNSTFYNFKNGIVDCESLTDVPSDIQVDNCTFNNIGLNKLSGKSLFDLRVNTNTNCKLKITDCIFGSINKDSAKYEFSGFRFTPEAYAEMSYCAMSPEFIFDTLGYGTVEWDQNEWNVEDIDPGFEDPENADFTIPLESDIRQMSQEGGPIGDPRWTEIIQSAINEKGFDEQIVIYPVPVENVLNIKSETAGIFVIYDIAGIKVKEFEVFANQIHTEGISDLKSGVYFINKKGTESFSKIIKL